MGRDLRKGKARRRCGGQPGLFEIEPMTQKIDGQEIQTDNRTDIQKNLYDGKNPIRIQRKPKTRKGLDHADEDVDVF